MFCNFQLKKEEKTIKCEIKKLTFHEIQTRRRVANGTPLATLLRLNLQKKNSSNSLNFEAKIKCNTIKPNVPKWRKTCTGLKFDLLNFYGPQSNIHTF